MPFIKPGFILSVAVWLAAALTAQVSCAAGPMKGPPASKAPSAPPGAVASGGAGEDFVIAAYQKVLSPVGGARCRMHPSCSRYARESLNRYGLLKGWIMTCGRLLRCGRDECRLSPEVWVQGRKKCWDPVSANALWRPSSKRLPPPSSGPIRKN